MRVKSAIALFITTLIVTACSRMENESSMHVHTHGKNHGLVVPISTNGEPIGFAELKLHDDKGDLELWLTTDAEGNDPLDLPLDTGIEVAFPDLDNKTVELRIRNDRQNEDENGNATLRNGTTNYFIFPGETGVDASFLKGPEFSSTVVISFETEQGQVQTAPFELSPHVH